MRDLIRKKIVDALAAPLPVSTRRDVRLPAVSGKAIAVIGPRRAGKTTFLWQVMQNREPAGAPRERTLYFSFEDERLVGLTGDRLGLILEEFYRLHPHARDRVTTLLLDEVQVVPGWEQFARRVLDDERVELFLSGSSAQLLSREVATSMRGRAMEALVFPFSFREFLRHRAIEPEQAALRLSKRDRSVIDSALRVYLDVGGYPEAQGVEERDRFQLLRGYVDAAMLRDVIERYSVSQPVALRWMVRHLLSSPSGKFSVNRIHKDLRSQGIHIAKDTLYAYLAHLEDAFLVHAVSIATESERRRMVNPRKSYPVDPGLIPVFDRSSKANRGHKLETVVALELARRGADISYVRTTDGFEVDFLARGWDGTEQLIQVCTRIDDPVTLDREIRALRSAAHEHPRASLHLVVLDVDTTAATPEDVDVHAAWTWLLTGERS